MQILNLLLHNIHRDALRLCFQLIGEQKHDYKMCASNTVPLEKKGFLTNSETYVYYLEGEFQSYLWNLVVSGTPSLFLVNELSLLLKISFIN